MRTSCRERPEPLQEPRYCRAETQLVVDVAKVKTVEVIISKLGDKLGLVVDEDNVKLLSREGSLVGWIDMVLLVVVGLIVDGIKLKVLVIVVNSVDGTMMVLYFVVVVQLPAV
jgi:hypothetical protein